MTGRKGFLPARWKYWRRKDFMRMLKKAIAVCFLISVLYGASRCETLTVVDSMVISPQNTDFFPDSADGFRIAGILISGDTVYAACDQGIIAKNRGEVQWRMVAGREEYMAVWGDKITAAGEYGQYRPQKIWKMPSGELGIFDSWLICRFYSLDPGAPPGKWLSPLTYPDEESIIERFDGGKDILLCGLYSIHHNRMIGIMNPDLSGYRRIFDIPPRLRHDLDSMGADYYPHAAFNPNDSTFWVAFENYNILYIVDRKGDVLDSVRITHPDFVLPQPPASRIKSWAVFQDWDSKCASIYSLQFAEPGYFLLLFSGPGKSQGDRTNRSRHLLCWNTNGKPIDLAVNPEWVIIQTQADGIIPFVAYEREGGVVKRAIIYLTRIKS
jgi:hypothetical protein